MFLVLKWAEESLVSYAPWFHLISWGLPTLKAGAILILAGVQGDNVAGICYTGILSKTFILNLGILMVKTMDVKLILLVEKFDTPSLYQPIKKCPKIVKLTNESNSKSFHWEN